MVTKKQLLEAIQRLGFIPTIADIQRAAERAVKTELDKRFAPQSVTKPCEHCKGTGTTKETVPPEIVRLVDSLRKGKK